MTETDLLRAIDGRLDRMQRWQERHESRHTADQALLASIVDSLANHESNHHGIVSKAKASGVAGFLAGIIIAFIELARLLAG